MVPPDRHHLVEPEVLLPGLVIKHLLRSQVERSRSMLELSVKTIELKMNLGFDWATFLLFFFFNRKWFLHISRSRWEVWAAFPEKRLM